MVLAVPASLAITFAVLRGALLDLLATGDAGRTTAAVTRHLTLVSQSQPEILEP